MSVNKRTACAGIRKMSKGIRYFWTEKLSRTQHKCNPSTNPEKKRLSVREAVAGRTGPDRSRNFRRMVGNTESRVIPPKRGFRETSPEDALASKVLSIK